LFLSLKSVHNFLSNLADRHTDAQTNRQTEIKHNVLLSAEVIAIGLVL